MNQIQQDILEILSLKKLPPVAFSAFDLSRLPLPKDMSICPAVAEYFTNCVPSAFIDTYIHRLFHPEELIKENTGAVPCVQLCPLGFVGIGSFLDGDSISVDIQTGKVHVFSHETDYEEEFTNRNEIMKSADESVDSIAEFVRIWKEMIREEVATEEAFQARAAVDPHATDDSGETRLFRLIADKSSTTDQLDAELLRGSNAEHQNNVGETPLMRAVIFQRPEFVKILIEGGADVDARTPRDFTTPLMFAARYSTLPCLKILLAAGANADAVDSTGWTALKQVCAVHGTDEMRELLRAHMASKRK